MAVDQEARDLINDILGEFATRPDGGTWGVPADFSVLVRQDQPPASGSSQFKVEDVPVAQNSYVGRVTGDIVDRTFAEVLADIGAAGSATAVTAAAAIADHAILRGAGGARGVQDSSASIADNGAMSVPAIGDGGIVNHDLVVGNPSNYGMIKIGNASFGRTSYNVGNIDLDGAILCKNTSGPVTGEIEFIWTESTGGTARFALPKSGVGNATYNSRSMFCAGPAPADTDFVKVSYWQTQGIFHNLVCDTAGNGADFGVQNDLEVEGIIFTDNLQESTPAAGIAISGDLALGTNDIVSIGTIADHIIGADIQAWDGDLDSIAAIAGGGFLTHTAADTYNVRSFVGTANQITVVEPLGVTGNPTFSIATNPTLPGTTTLTPTLAGSLTTTGYAIVDAGNINLEPAGIAPQVVIGSGAAGKDYSLKFNGETNDGILSWLEDEAQFHFDSNVRINDNIKAQYGTDSDAAIYYTGTDLIIDSRAVGSGSVVFGDGSDIRITPGGAGGGWLYSGSDTQIIGITAGVSSSSTGSKMILAARNTGRATFGHGSFTHVAAAGHFVQFRTEDNGVVTTEWRIDENHHLVAQVDDFYVKWGTGEDAGLTYDGTDLLIDSALVGSGVCRFNASSNWTANGTAAVTISNVAPAGVGTATISKWFTVKDDAGTVYYIPAWT